MEFEDLWKFHAPVNTVEGFDVSLFDKLIEVVNGLKIFLLLCMGVVHDLYDAVGTFHG